jgi:hypothetical protein
MDTKNNVCMNETKNVVERIKGNLVLSVFTVFFTSVFETIKANHVLSFFVLWFYLHPLRE